MRKLHRKTMPRFNLEVSTHVHLQNSAFATEKYGCCPNTNQGMPVKWQNEHVKKNGQMAAAKTVMAATESNDRFKFNGGNNLCAERRLLADVYSNFCHKKGKRPTIQNMRRELGTVLITRHRQDGTLGCSRPCDICLTALANIDAKIKFVDESGCVCVVRARELQASGKIAYSDRVKWGIAHKK